MLAALFLCVFDEPSDAFQLRFAELWSLQFEEGGDGLLRRIVEERLEHVGERRPPRRFPTHSGAINVGTPVFLMHYSPLLLEGTQRCTYGGVTGWIRNTVHDFSDRCITALKEKIHDLSLSATQSL